MIEKWLRNHERWLLIGWCLVFFGLCSSVAIVRFRFFVNPDASSYFSIATKYAHFDFRHAINGYWGPLFSWLLVPFVWLHTDLIIAARELLALTAVAIIVVVYFFWQQRGVSILLRYLLIGLLSIYLFEQVVGQSITPDLLIVMFSLSLVVLLSEFITHPSKALAILIGLNGALLYFTKGFGFYLFIAVVGSVALWQLYLERQWAAVVRRFLPLAIVFLVLTLPFIGVISLKYRTPTINTAGSFDHNLYGPVARGTAYPMLTLGPLPPPNSTATSVWEDPTRITPLIPGTGWSPLSSLSNLHYYIGSVVIHNLQITLSSLLTFGPLIVIGLILMIIGLLPKSFYRQEFSLMTLLAGLMVLGYSLVYTDSRYLWTLLVFGIMAVGLWLEAMQKAKVLRSGQLILGGLLVAGLTIFSVRQALINDRSLQHSQLRSQLARAYSGVPAGSHIISDTFESYKACHYLSLRCYSVLNPTTPDDVGYAQLLKHYGIKYYADYHTQSVSKVQQQFVSRFFTKINEQIVMGRPLTMYQIR